MLNPVWCPSNIYLVLWQSINQPSSSLLAAHACGGCGGFVREHGVHVTLCGLCSCAVQSKGSEYCAPLTSFDWNQTDPSMIITSSIDTTCALWDLEVREQEHPHTHAHTPTPPSRLPLPWHRISTHAHTRAHTHALSALRSLDKRTRALSAHSLCPHNRGCTLTHICSPLWHILSCGAAPVLLMNTTTEVFLVLLSLALTVPAPAANLHCALPDTKSGDAAHCPRQGGA